MLLKKLFQTILILVGIVIMLAMLAFAIMMIGGVSLFGYSYISLNYKTNPQTVDNTFDVTNISKIDVDTSNMNIRIIKPDLNPSGNTGYFAFIVDMQGIVKSDVKNVSFKDSVKPEIVGDTLVIKTVAPDGLFFKNNTVLEINLPQDKVVDEIKINTNSKELSFGDSEFEVKKLDVTVGKSLIAHPVTLSSKLKITEELKINANYGRVNVDSTLEGDVIVDSSAGSIIINKDISGDLIVKGDNPLVSVGTIPGNWRNRRDLTASDLNSLKPVNVGGDLFIDNLESGGNIKISGSVKNVTISQSSIIEFWANKISGVVSCNDGSNNIRVFGSLGAENTAGISTINTGNGSLFVNNPRCKLDIYAQKGDVFVESAYNDVKINSTNGSSVVHFNPDAPETCILNVTNENWNIEATNIKGKSYINAKNGSVIAKFLKVAAQTSEIYASKNIDVEVKDGSTFKLITSSQLNSGSVSVNMPPKIFTNWDGALTEGGWRNKTTLINTNNDSIENVLLLRITGNDKITAKLVV